jgi:hypothetical protein
VRALFLTVLVRTPYNAEITKERESIDQQDGRVHGEDHPSCNTTCSYSNKRLGANDSVSTSLVGGATVVERVDCSRDAKTMASRLLPFRLSCLLRLPHKHILQQFTLEKHRKKAAPLLLDDCSSLLFSQPENNTDDDGPAAGQRTGDTVKSKRYEVTNCARTLSRTFVGSCLTQSCITCYHVLLSSSLSVNATLPGTVHTFVWSNCYRTAPDSRL